MHPETSTWVRKTYFLHLPSFTERCLVNFYAQYYVRHHQRWSQCVILTLTSSLPRYILMISWCSCFICNFIESNCIDDNNHNSESISVVRINHQAGDYDYTNKYRPSFWDNIVANSKWNVRAIVGSTVGGVFCLVLLSALAWWLVFHHCRMRTAPSTAFRAAYIDRHVSVKRHCVIRVLLYSGRYSLASH